MPLSHKPPVIAVVLNYNQPAMTAGCVRAALASDYPALQIIIVDNGSRDDSAARLRAEFPDLDLVERIPNAGIAGGFNAGLARALELAPAYIILLSNDVIPAADMITRLVERFEAAPQTGALGPLNYYFDQPDVIWAAGANLPPVRGTGQHIGLNQKDTGQYREPFKVDYAPGSGWAVRAAALRQVGLLDESLYFVAEDSDFCLRARRAGWTVECVPAAHLWHKVSASTSNEPNRYVCYYDIRNKLVLVRRHYFAVFGPISALAYLNIARHTLLRLFQAARRRNLAGIRYLALAWRDFLIGRMGSPV